MEPNCLLFGVKCYIYVSTINSPYLLAGCVPVFSECSRIDQLLLSDNVEGCYCIL